MLILEHSMQGGHMETEIIFIIEESSETGYEARALGYSIYTEADTIEELKIMVKDAVRCHFDEQAMPKLIRLHYIKEEIVAS
jgi:hypothetical protein